MPDDTTEGVAEHSSRLQPSINLHAPVTAFVFSCSGTDVLSRRDEGSGKLIVYVSCNILNESHM